jgi:hypothetical protein
MLMLEAPLTHTNPWHIFDRCWTELILKCKNQTCCETGTESYGSYHDKDSRAANIYGSAAFLF